MYIYLHNAHKITSYGGEGCISLQDQLQFNDMKSIRGCREKSGKCMWGLLKHLNTTNNDIIRLVLATKYVYKEYHSVCPLVGIGTLPTLSRQWVCPSPQNREGRMRGRGSPHSVDWRKGLALYGLSHREIMHVEENPGNDPNLFFYQWSKN